MTAYFAILRYDASALRHARLIHLWLVLLAAPALFLVVVASTQDELASETLAAYLGWVLLPLSVAAVAVIAGAAINAEARVAADTVLSRAVTREVYLAAKTTARVAAVLLGYALVAVPAAALIARYGVADTSTTGVAAGLIVVAALLWLLTTAGLALSVVVERVPLAVLGVIVAAAAVALVSEVFGLGWLSPLELLGTLAEVMRGDAGAWRAFWAAAIYGVGGLLILLATFWRYRGRDL